MKILEEALKNLIRRVEILESKELKSEPKEQEFIGTATKPQRDLILKLGGKIPNNLTKHEAGHLIDGLKKLNSKKKLKEIQTIKPVIIDTDNLINESAYPEAVYKIENESKPLTKKEIEEIGEENLL